MPGKYWQVQDARLAVSSAAFKLMSMEDALRDAEKRVPPMAAVFTCWKAELRQRDRTGSMRQEIDSLPDHPALERVALYKCLVLEAQKGYDLALAELKRVEALPDDPPPVITARVLDADAIFLNSPLDSPELLDF